MGSFQPLQDGDPRAVGGYRLLAVLGSGGMGRVYLSYTPGGRAVAVKVIRPELAESAEFRRRFQAEVAAASRVHGLYTAPVVDSDTEGPVPWCATAFVPGPSLADAVRDHGPLPVDTVLRLIAGVAEALQAVHREGIVHRDLKPSNVLLAADGPRVIDFGVARAGDTPSMTQRGVALGTVAYMAPEQALGADPAPSADVFALGQTAVFAATARPAFGEGEPHAVLYRVVHEEPDLGRVPDEIRDLVTWCLRKPAAERPSVGEVIRSVQAIRGPQAVRMPQTSGSWLPDLVAAGIAARAEGADQARADAPPTPAPHPAYTPTSPSHGVLPAPVVVGPASPQGVFGPPQGDVPDRRRSRRAWVAAMAAVALVACGATAALLLVPGDEGAPREASGAPTAASSAPATPTSAPSSAGPTPTASKKPKPSPSRTPSAGSAPTRRSASPTASPKATAPKQPTAVTYSGIRLEPDHDLYLANTPVRPTADTGSTDEDLTYAVYTDGAVLAPGTTSGTTMTPLPTGRQGSLDACRAATAHQDYVWTQDLTAGQQLCLVTGTGHVGLVTYRGSSGTSYATLDVKVWRDAA
ncbi:serine/threonine-protein kinase [Streptomyces sp. NPDC051940]|uniref:serine/threonine protein kinase n=1 Tax=Streptomyces sp. NPDC051940 TaxID=3155675 RepID=UPI003424BB71